MKTLSPSKSSPSFIPSDGSAAMGLLDSLQRSVRHLQASGRYGTARNYHAALRSLTVFCQGQDIPIGEVTEAFVSRYAVWMQSRGLIPNSQSFYLRILRAVCHTVLPSCPSLFRHVYTGVDQTRKRSLDEHILIALHTLKLPVGSPRCLARDLFLFSYCTRGMSFVDMAYLLKSSVRNGYIHYTRRKTGQPLAVRIEPLTAAILHRYTSVEGPYVFPILQGEEGSRGYRRYQIALNYYNRQLKRIAEQLHIAGGLTIYMARHTWATVARNQHVPISVISAGMGHTSEQTTRIYLASIDNHLIDDANRMLTERIG